MAEYLQRLFYYAFSGAWAIANAALFIFTICGGIISWKYPRKESIVKKLVWIIPLSIFGVALIVSLAIVAPYKICKDQKQEIERLKSELTAQKQSSNPDIKPVTQQEIRTFLEIINPQILQEIDNGQNHLHVLVSIPKQMIGGI